MRSCGTPKSFSSSESSIELPRWEQPKPQQESDWRSPWSSKKMSSAASRVNSMREQLGTTHTLQTAAKIAVTRKNSAPQVTQPPSVVTRARYESFPAAASTPRQAMQETRPLIVDFTDVPLSIEEPEVDEEHNQVCGCDKICCLVMSIIFGCFGSLVLMVVVYLVVRHGGNR